MLSSQQVELVGLRADLGAKGLAPGADVERILDQLDRAMESAAGLQAPMMCVDLGPLAEPAAAEKPRPAITPEQAGLIILPTVTPAPAAPSAPPPVDDKLMSSVNAALLELCSRADRYNVTLALRSSLASFAALQHATRSARCPWFGIDLDPVSMLTDNWTADEIFSALGPQVRHVRARDAELGADRRTKPAVIGQGSFEWAALLTRLDESGYRGWITVDPVELTDRRAAATAGRNALVHAMT
jgi:sugar phosphate isomerase/epimerase